MTVLRRSLTHAGGISPPGDEPRVALVVARERPGGVAREEPPLVLLFFFFLSAFVIVGSWLILSLVVAFL